jgi:hypothetical protein
MMTLIVNRGKVQIVLTMMVMENKDPVSLDYQMDTMKMEILSILNRVLTELISYGMTK